MSEDFAIKQYNRIYYRMNRERILNRKKAKYRDAHPLEEVEARRLAREQNRLTGDKKLDSQRAACRAYYHRNKEKFAAYHKEWEAEHREERNAYRRKYYAEHREEILAKAKAKREAEKNANQDS